MKLQDKKNTKTINDITIKNETEKKEHCSLESKIKQQNSKISHLLEKIDNLQKNNEHMMLLLEELLFTITNKNNSIEEKQIEKTVKANKKNLNTCALEQLIKFN